MTYSITYKYTGEKADKYEFSNSDTSYVRGSTNDQSVRIFSIYGRLSKRNNTGTLTSIKGATSGKEYLTASCTSWTVPLDVAEDLEVTVSTD